MKIDLNLHKINSQASYSPLRSLYSLFHQAVTGCVNRLAKIGLKPLGATLGMVLFEPLTLIKVVLRTLQFRKDPTAYGLNSFKNDKAPVILVHGAAGNWRYMADFAQKLSASRSVFVIDLGLGGPSEDKRARLQGEISRIQGLYFDRFKKETRVDMIAHSMGGLVGLAALFTQESISINSEGDVVAKEGINPEAFPSCRKLITIAMPIDDKEKSLISRIHKLQDVSSILARYEQLMDLKKHALAEGRTKTLEAAHVGIVYHENLAERVDAFLKN